MSEEFSDKTLAEIMQELEQDFNNDFDAYCSHYNSTEPEMLRQINERLTDDCDWAPPAVQATLLIGLMLIDGNISSQDYYRYLSYIVNPRYTDEYRKETMYSRFSEINLKRNTLEQLAESGDWKGRAYNILTVCTGFQDGDILGFIDEYWQNLRSDMENIEEFIIVMRESIEKLTEDFESLENCHIRDGETVYWKDPAGETSGYYQVQGDYPPYEQEEDEEDDDIIDDRIVDITNTSGSYAQVYPCELTRSQLIKK